MAKDPSPGRRVWFAYMAGQVRRWHNNPHIIRQQDVIQHSGGMATWISLLHPDPSVKLLKAALHHDLPELVTGDMPGWAKRNNPELETLLQRLEDKVNDKFLLVTEADLTEEEIRWLRSCDLFDAWLFALQNVVASNHFFQGTLNKCTRSIRDGFKAGELPVEISIAADQILAMYSWVKTW